MIIWVGTFWELTFCHIDVLGVDILGVDTVGVNVLGCDIPVLIQLILGVILQYMGSAPFSSFFRW